MLMIYYVEDDANIRDLARYTLSQADFDVETFPDADSFFDACEKRMPDLVLLDIMLPGKSGLEILQDLRSEPATSTLPIIMLSAKGSEIDKVSALDAGADDYLAKPFGMMELVSRVKALFRRAESSSVPMGSVLTLGEIMLNSEAHIVEIEGQAVALTLKEFDLLKMLMINRGRVLSRSQLLERVWGWDFIGNTRTVDVHVQTLRQKLSSVNPDAAAHIVTVRGIGYTIRD